MKALIAMSGGVDSSVAAKLMADAGYECVGCTMKLYDNADAGLPKEGTCCALTDSEDARSVCYRLGIDHHTVSFEADFRDKVIGDFISAYERGETPNPCIECNRHLKFERLRKLAAMLGCGYIATGHYARISCENGEYRLMKAADERKDQSYVLYNLKQETLSHVIFPLGDLTKSDVRTIADEAGLVTAHKRESQDICFVPDGDYAAAIERLGGIKSEPGDYIDKNGHILGRHKGVIHYTIGQHKRLGIVQSSPLYVTGIDPKENTVTLGDESDLFSDTCRVRDVNWISGKPPAGAFRCSVKSRYRQTEQPAAVEPLSDGGAAVRFDSPQRALTPGQSAVFYDGMTVIGGGKITKGAE